MIDFLSTRQTTDQTTAGCARLLAAVIAQAAQDAALGDKSAARFLFGKDHTFDVYARLIGTSAPGLRKRLVSDEPLPRGLRSRGSKRAHLQDAALQFTPRTPANAEFLHTLAACVNSRPPGAEDEAADCDDTDGEVAA
jgi:hypothetical protein